MLNEKEQPIGIAVELLTELLRRKKIIVNHLVMPWKRCLEDVEFGKVDLVPNSSFKAERAVYALFSEPLYETHLVLFYDKNRFKEPPVIKTIEELSHFVVGGILGFNYDQYEGKLKMDTGATNRESLMTKLSAQRLDFAVEQKEIIQMMAKEKKVNLSSIGDIPDPVVPVRVFHILISKKHLQAQEIKKLIDSGIAELKNDCFMKSVSSRYLN